MTTSFVTTVNSEQDDRKTIDAMLAELRSRLNAAQMDQAEPGQIAELASLSITMLAAASQRGQDKDIKKRVRKAVKALLDTVNQHLDNTDPGDCKRLAACLAGVEFTAATDEALKRVRAARQRELDEEHQRELEEQKKIRAEKAAKDK